MLTSEQQKIYNVKVPKGGYGYYTLYHGIYDPENDIDERPSYAQTGDLFEPEGSSVVYKATRKNGKTTWAIDENAQRQSESGENSGSGSGGGGAEKFIVTLTQENDTWTADKTIAEIVAADEAGKDVVVSFQYMGQIPTELPKVSWMHDPEGTSSFFMFSGIIYGESEEVAFIVGQQGDSSDVWQVTFTPIPTSSNAPLIVTLTADQSTGNFVGDKTNKEVYDALTAGQAVILSASVGSDVFKLAVQYATFDGTVYEFAFIDSSAVKNTVSGGANDYVTASLA